MGRLVEQGSFIASNCLKQKERLGRLLPKHSFVTPESLKRAVIQISEPQKATGQTSCRHGKRDGIELGCIAVRVL
jgi:hypothetical protein